MPMPPKKRSILLPLAALGIITALIAALLWYYDVYVHWQPKIYPFAVVAVILGNALLTLSTLWSRGERKAVPFIWKSLLSAAIFLAALFVPSTLINNVMHKGATLAANVAVPLVSAYILFQCVMLFLALKKRCGKSAWILPAGVCAAALAAAAALSWNYIYRVPQTEIVPVFPEARMRQELIPYDEGEFVMQEGDILADSIEQIRAINHTGDNPITVWLKGGAYAGPLEFAGLKNVTFRSVPGEEVILTGAAEITGWQADEVNGAACWSVPVARYFTSLYHPDPEKQLSRPRYPADGYLFVDHMDGARTAIPQEEASKLWDLTRAHTSLFAKEGDLRQFHALEDVTLRVLHYWKDEITNLVSYDAAARELIWKRPAAMTVRKDDRYFLENVFEELKQPGQWYLDRETSMLYYIPFEGERMESTVLYAGLEERLLTLDGSENVTFRGITFKNSAWNMPNTSQYGLEGMDSSQAAYGVHPCLLVTNSRGVNFDHCKFENIGATALKLAGNVHDSSVTGCEFTQIGGNAVFIEGEYDAPNSGITVKNNLIAHYGRRFFNAIGVLNIHAHHVEISQNEIFDGYYTGISSGWVWGYAENPTDYVAIENNLIYQIGQGWLSDMGGIYCLGIQEHSVIRGNHIHDVAADPLEGGYGGWGIYLDEGSTGQLVEKNLVYRCGSQSFHQHYGRENLVRNNIFAFSGEGQVRVSKKEDHTSILLERNIIVSDRQPIYTSVVQGKFRDDGNLYFDYARPGRLFADDDSSLGIPRMRGIGYYQNAVIADPLFKDARGLDFTLALNSPALTELGFEVWDYGAAGRTDEARAQAAVQAN